jgi:hypothetical protein
VALVAVSSSRTQGRREGIGVVAPSHRTAGAANWNLGQFNIEGVRITMCAIHKVKGKKKKGETNRRKFTF